MKSLIKLLLIIFIFLTTMMLILKVSGVLTVDQIKATLEAAKETSAATVSVVVIALLSADLLITVPTMTVSLLAGYFLGFLPGFLTVVAGLMIAGHAGYFLSRRFGGRIFRFLIKNKKERIEAVKLFRRHGFIIIVLSRALPMIPEATACLSGLTRLPYRKFLMAWSLNTIPYAVVTTYAGSISSVENPLPAILAAGGLTGLFALLWYLFQKRNRGDRDG